MSFLRFHRNSDFKPLNPKNDLTLRDEYAHHKAVAQKTSLQFLFKDVSFLTISLKGFQKSTLQTKQKQCYDTAQ